MAKGAEQFYEGDKALIESCTLPLEIEALINKLCKQRPEIKLAVKAIAVTAFQMGRQRERER